MQRFSPIQKHCSHCQTAARKLWRGNKKIQSIRKRNHIIKPKALGTNYGNNADQMSFVTGKSIGKISSKNKENSTYARTTNHSE